MLRRERSSKPITNSIQFAPSVSSERNLVCIDGVFAVDASSVWIVNFHNVAIRQTSNRSLGFFTHPRAPGGLRMQKLMAALSGIENCQGFLFFVPRGMRKDMFTCFTYWQKICLFNACLPVSFNLIFFLLNPSNPSWSKISQPINKPPPL